MKRKCKSKYSTKLKRKVSTMHLGRVYYDGVLKTRKEMFDK